MTGNAVHALRYHAGEWDDSQRLLADVCDQVGTVDRLVNNAGMSPLYDTVADVSEALFDKVIAVSLGGPFRLTALAGTAMTAGSGRAIINVSSMGAFRARPHIIPYAAAKAGLNAMTVGFAHAFRP